MWKNKPETVPGCCVEKARLQDAAMMLDLWRAIPEMGVGRGDDAGSLEAFMAKNPSTCLVVKKNRRIIGTVLGGFDGRRGYLYHLAVHPDYQGKGYGKMLLRKVTYELKLLGAPKIHLFAFSDNPKAAQFYEDRGWERRRDIRVFSWDTNI